MTFFTRCKRLIQNRKGLSIPELLIAITISGVIVGTVGQVFPSLILTNDNMKVALLGQALASNKWNELHIKSFADIESEDRITIDPDAKLDRQVVVTTTDLGEGRTRKDVHIKIFRTGTSKEVFTLPMEKLSYQNSGSSSVPPGTILPWWGSLSNIPDGFAYCDGTNGTPNLRGRTLLGSGTWTDSFGSQTYALGDSGGTMKVALTADNIPPHRHLLFVGGNGMEGNLTSTNFPSTAGRPEWGSYSYLIQSFTTTEPNVGLSGSSGDGVPYNNMMPYTAVHWIMKL